MHTIQAGVAYVGELESGRVTASLPVRTEELSWLVGHGHCRYVGYTYRGLDLYETDIGKTVDQITRLLNTRK